MTKTASKPTQADVVTQTLAELAAVATQAPSLSPGYSLTQEDVTHIRDVLIYICGLYSATVDTTSPVLELLTTVDGLSLEASSRKPELNLGNAVV